MENSRAVKKEEVTKYCEKRGFFYQETSAFQDNGGIKKTFEYIAEKIVDVDDKENEIINEMQANLESEKKIGQFAKKKIDKGYCKIF